MSSDTLRLTGKSGHQAANREGATIAGLLIGGVSVFLRLVMSLSGGLEFARADMRVRYFEQWDHLPRFRVETGATKMLRATGLFLRRRLPWLRILGGTLISGTVMGAIHTYLVRIREFLSEVSRPIAIFLNNYFSIKFMIDYKAATTLALGSRLRQTWERTVNTTEGNG
jgi:hypothetical protein